MATVRVELKHEPDKEGKHTVFISVSHHSKVGDKYVTKRTRINTGIKIKKNHFYKAKDNYGKWVKSKVPNHRKLNQFLKDEYNKADEKLSKQGYESISNEPSLSEYVEKEIKRCKAEGMYRSAEKLRHAHNKMQVYYNNMYGTTNIKFKNITQLFLDEYRTYLMTEKKDASNKEKGDSDEKEYGLGNHINTVASDYKRIKAVFKRAVKYKVISANDDPFYAYKIEQKATRKDKLTIAEIKRIETLELNEYTPEWHVKNYFLFSYFCAGIRFGDLAQLKWKNIKAGEEDEYERLSYVMSKTSRKDGSEHSIKLPEKAKEILKHYDKDKDDNKYIFPLLNPELKGIVAIKNNISSKNTMVNRHLKLIKVKAQIKTNLSFHISRHSFSDHLRKKDVSVHTIKGLLGHSDIKTTETYLASFDTEAEDKAMDNLFGE